MLGLVLVLVTGLALVGYLTATLPTAVRLAVRALLVLLYGPLVVALRLYRPEELREGWRWLRRRWEQMRTPTG
ncbi:hypothetical protein [Rhodothermus marinus]|uniref:hypothetical protein n=1 Tax=Rhodothermus marinus TaxID=29549 RepID=UPI001FB36522|nr:hypothetical protein [Rhodothermus marinus]